MFLSFISFDFVMAYFPVRRHRMAAAVMGIFMSIVIWSPIQAFTPAPLPTFTHHQSISVRQRPLPLAVGWTHRVVRQASPPFLQAEELSSASTEVEDVWQVAEDPASGKTYYWNTETQEVSWTKPGRTIKGKARALLDDS